MLEVIKTNNDLCTGCNRCVRECPMETANITYQDEAGNIKVKIDYDKCIVCGRCIHACKHDSRYYVDDTERFFDDLAKGIPISLMVAPSVRTNIIDYKRLFTYLKRRGINKIYDVSLGADISVWAHIRHLEKNNFAPIITQPCPVVVQYCEKYRHDLFKWLSPVHGPTGSLSVYMKRYEGITDRIAGMTPCIAKSHEFYDSNQAEYNITFPKMLEYLTKNNIRLPDEETSYDHHESGLGSLFPMPGGLKENIEYFMGKKLHITKAEGFHVFNKLNEYAETPEAFLPGVFDVLNCIEGCNVGPASSHVKSMFEIDKTMNKKRQQATEERKRDYYESVYKTYDDTFILEHFIRVYKPVFAPFPQINDTDISKAFMLLGKTDHEKQNVDCSACGSETCLHMARKIALNVNIPVNCIVKTMEDAKVEHQQNILVHSQLAEMEKMHEADERMRILLDATPLAAHFWDENTNIIDCNQAAVTMFELTDKHEYIDRYFELTPEFQPDGSRSIDKLRQLVAKTYEEGRRKFEWMRRSLDGSPLPVEMTMVRVDVKGRKLIAGYCWDLREYNRMMEDIRSASSRLAVESATLKTMFDSVPDLIFCKDLDLNYTRCNESLLEYYNLKKEDLIGKNDMDGLKVSRKKAEEFRNLDRKTIAERRVLTYEENLPARDGTMRLFETKRIPLQQDGEVVGIMGIARDITERKAMEEAAKNASKAKSAFLSTMSHEIRTPMNAILGITEIQLQDESLNLNVREALEKIYASSDMLLGIINDILDLSRIEAGKLELTIDRYQIASLVSDTAQLNMMHIGSKPIEFELYVDENTPANFFGDELRVKQILNNLLSNAFKYTMEGTVKLSVTAETATGDDDTATLIFVISDTGQGMTIEQIDKLFDEYSRFNMEANRSTEGTGLGMSITQNLIRLMGGEIFIESKPGKGSEFTVRLPQGMSGSEVLGREVAANLHQFRTNRRAQMKRVQISREPMPYGSVLIVDDVETNIYVARGLLSAYELKVDSADSGVAAIEKIRQGNLYDIVFMDHMMPKMDGVEATKIIRETGYTRPIVALTANAVSGQADMFLTNGFDDFISKPIDIRQLNTILNKLIRDRQPPEVIQAVRKTTLTENKKPGAEPRQIDNSRFAVFFVKDALKALKILEAIVEKNDYGTEENLRAYIINVHGMKSATASMGKMDLSAAAHRLEVSAREGNLDILTSETPDFIGSLRAYVEELTPNEDHTGGEMSGEDRTLLREKLLIVKTACGKFDEDTTDETIRELNKKTWPQPVGELLGRLAEYLLHSDFDAIAAAIDKEINR